MAEDDATEAQDKPYANDRRRHVWIGTPEAITLLGGDDSVLDRLIDEGRVTATRIGPIPYVNLRDLYPLTKTTT